VVLATRIESAALTLPMSDDKNMEAAGEESDAADSHEEATNSRPEAEGKLNNDETMSDSGNSEETNGSDDERQQGEAEKASDSSSDEDSQNDEEDDNSRGIPAIERRRMRNIERNQATLAQLGLHSTDDGGILGKRQSSSRRRRRSVSSDAANLGPKRRSKRSEGKSISYVEPSLRNVLDTDQPTKLNPEEAENIVPATPKKTRGRPAKESTRMARFVYDEFQTITTHKRKMLKEAETNLRSAETEIKYWQKKAAIEEKRVARETELEQLRKSAEEEMKIFGTSAKGFLQKLEAQTVEIGTKIRIYDSRRAVSFG
jgi:hypothetical protein